MKAALRNWLIQRFSAVVLALYSFFMPVYLWLLKPEGAAGWHAVFTPLPLRLMTMLFVFALALHAWVGMRSILLDYVSSPFWDFRLHLLIILWLFGCVLAMAVILW